MEEILSEIDRFENDYGTHIEVILARIVNRNPNMSLISDFNSNVASMANRRINQGDDIRIVNMEHDAGINYREDLKDGTHPNDCGYEKMANVWFSALTGNGSPGLDQGGCRTKKQDEIRDALKAYPSTLVPTEYIISSEVNEKTKTVTFTVGVPTNGIIF